MKTIKTFLLAFFLELCFFPLMSCTFFYGESTELSYESMFDAMWKDYNQTYALFEVRGVDWDA